LDAQFHRKIAISILKLIIKLPLEDYAKILVGDSKVDLKPFLQSYFAKDNLII